MCRREVVIEDILEKYDNSIAELVRVACQFSSTVIIADKDHRVNAKSIMGIMAFHPTRGKTVCIEAEGSDEAEAAKAMADFLRCI